MGRMRAISANTAACGDAVNRSYSRASALAFVIRSAGEPRISQPGSDGQNAPVSSALHVGDLAEALDDRIIVHHHDRIVPIDPGYALADGARQIEPAAFPVARQIVRAAFDEAILADDSRAPDADHRRQWQGA